MPQRKPRKSSRTELTPAIRKQILTLSGKKEITTGLKEILREYRRYKKVRDKIEAAFRD